MTEGFSMLSHNIDTSSQKHSGPNSDNTTCQNNLTQCDLCPNLQ